MAEEANEELKKEINAPAMTSVVTETSVLAEKENAASAVLLGPIGVLGDYHFPSELVGGCCPRIMGEEEKIVWNAASESSDSERIHLVYQAKGDKIWYLAIRSSDLASHVNTWCPFASLLPGMKDSVSPPVCYTFYSDEAATMMTITSDGLQIHRGTSSVVRAKAERMSRSLGDAPVIELTPDRIEKMTPVPWQSLSLFEDRARRILAALSVAAALMVTSLAIVIWFFAGMALIASRADLDEIRSRTETKTTQLMRSVQEIRASPMREQLAKFSDLNDGLLSLNALLEVYQIQKGKVLWRARVPPNITSNLITQVGAQTLDSSADGTIIGNSKEALAVGQAGGKK